jgi:hypothetical protein
MISIQDFYTGVRTQNGEKVYLGDKLTGDFYFPMLVQYNFEENKFTVTTTGKSKSPYRSYLIEDIPHLGGLRVISNTIFYNQVKIGEEVKVTVRNIKGAVFSLGDVVKIIAINEWDVQTESEDGLRSATLQFHEFLPLWRWED